MPLTLVAIVFVLLCFWSWGKWADPLVDFGRELYTPWRLTEGDYLGRDIAPLFGPLSIAINAALFQVFGVHIWTVFGANLIFLAIFTIGIYWLIRQLTHAWTAAIVCVFQLCVFGFSQYLLTSGYNFVAPYSHEMTHGLGLMVLLLIATYQYLRSHRTRWLILGGLSVGLAVLTKLEPALAALTVSAVFLIHLTLRERPPAKLASRLTLFVGFALLPVLACFALLLAHRSGQEAWQLTSNAFSALQHPEVRALDFYQKISGWNDPLPNLQEIGWATLLISAAATILYLVDRQISHATEIIQRATVTVVGGLVLMLGWYFFPKANGALLLPFFSLIATVYWSYRLVAVPGITVADQARTYAFTAWSVAGLVLLLKIFLAPSWVFYGFTLSLLATLQLLVFFCDSLPRFAKKKHNGGKLLHNIAVLTGGLLALTMLRQAQIPYAYKSLAWETPFERLLVMDKSFDPRSTVLQPVTDHLLSSLPPEATLAVVPEGVTLNYMLRRRNPTPYINLMPPEVLIFTEQRLLESWQKTPPDWVVWWPKDTREYGQGEFGAQNGYAANLKHWIEHCYVTDREFVSPAGTIRVLKLRSETESRTSETTPAVPDAEPESAERQSPEP